MRGGTAGAKEEARRATKKARPWIEGMARFGYAAYGVVYVLVGVLSVRAAFGTGGGGSGGPDDWTATLLQQPFGRWLVGAVGAVVFAIGLFQFYRAYDAKFMEKLKPGEMDPREKRWTRRAGRLGHAARGVVFLVIGVFLAQAALQFDAQEVRGLGGVLSELAA